MKNNNVTEDASPSATPVLDPNISIQARFLWVLVRLFEAHRPDKPVKSSELIGILGVGEDTLRNYRLELVEHGFLLAECGRDGANRFAGVHYFTLPSSEKGDPLTRLITLVQLAALQNG